MAADAKGSGSQHLAVFDIGLGTLLVENIEQHAILCLRGHDDHVLEVLGSSTDERDAAYVYLLDDVSLRGTTGHGLLEGIEVHDDEIDFGYLVLGHLLAVALIVAACQYASKHLGMQGFHPTAQDRRIGRHLLYLLAFVA